MQPILQPKTSAKPAARITAEPQPIATLSSRLAAAVRALRPRQWVKNALLFVPLLLAHEISNVEKLTAAALAFLALSCCASAVYVSNDLVDVESDRRHPVKRKRPASKPGGSVNSAPSSSLAMGARANQRSITLPQSRCTSRATAPIWASEKPSSGSLRKSINRASRCSAANSVVSQTEFIGTRRETFVFITVIYFVISYVIASVSRRIEATGVGAARRV